MCWERRQQLIVTVGVSRPVIVKRTEKRNVDYERKSDKRNLGRRRVRKNTNKRGIGNVGKSVERVVHWNVRTDVQ